MLRRINKLPWSYVKELYDYWEYEPPTHLLIAKIARAFGVHGKLRPGYAKLTDDEETIAANAALVTPVSAGLRTLQDLPPSVADWIKEVVTKEGVNAAN